nr:hypothetical protein [uncultured Sphaerochaeta sp.]
MNQDKTWEKMIDQAEAGNSVYISNIRDLFLHYPESESENIHLLLLSMENDEKLHFQIKIPDPKNASPILLNFIERYLYAEIYNILSTLGGSSLQVFYNKANASVEKLCHSLDTAFGIYLSRHDRPGYGRCINVIDRMLSALIQNTENSLRFKFEYFSENEFVNPKKSVDTTVSVPYALTRSVSCLGEKIICGVDIGGTDIKLVLTKGDNIIAFKEYDWFPAQFTRSSQLVGPIVLLVRLLRAVATIELEKSASKFSKSFRAKMKVVLDRYASEEAIEEFCSEIESLARDALISFDGIGLCFPDVVIKDKVVGGEVYKTRGIRNNPNIDFEKDFVQLTDLNLTLEAFCKQKGSVSMINDGPMAAFTAAVELAASASPEMVKNGVFAHTLGTELGTGWVREDGSIPDIPLEVYNCIIDLGCTRERGFQPDDLRSINNFNTGLAGTLQKYASQSGIFRLAVKYFPIERPDLYKELFEKGFVKIIGNEDSTTLIVPTEPDDMRKPFLEHMMALVDRENDATNRKIWKEVGMALGVTWLETDRMLNPAAKARIQFGRLVKKKSCFDLLLEGARIIAEDIEFEVADSTLANTTLMKLLEADEHYTVAQFAQAVGAVYYANEGLIRKGLV